MRNNHGDVSLSRRYRTVTRAPQNAAKKGLVIHVNRTALRRKNLCFKDKCNACIDSNRCIAW
jgi:hypothetical protein